MLLAAIHLNMLTTVQCARRRLNPRSRAANNNKTAHETGHEAQVKLLLAWQPVQSAARNAMLLRRAKGRVTFAGYAYLGSGMG